MTSRHDWLCDWFLHWYRHYQWNYRPHDECFLHIRPLKKIASENACPPISLRTLREVVRTLHCSKAESLIGSRPPVHLRSTWAFRLWPLSLHRKEHLYQTGGIKTYQTLHFGMQTLLVRCGSTTHPLRKPYLLTLELGPTMHSVTDIDISCRLWGFPWFFHTAGAQCISHSSWNGKTFTVCVCTLGKHKAKFTEGNETTVKGNHIALRRS